MGIIKETDNITLDIYWKEWIKPDQRTAYILKTRKIANEIDASAEVSSRMDGCTFIRVELPHKELDNYQNLDDNEYLLDYTKVYQLVEKLKTDNDVTSIQMEIKELEKGGNAYVIDHSNYEVIKRDKEGLALVIRLYSSSKS